MRGWGERRNVDLGRRERGEGKREGREMGRGERDGGAGGGSAGGGSDSYPCPAQPAAPILHSIPNNIIMLCKRCIFWNVF